MKRAVSILILILSFSPIFAQEHVELKNAGNEALRAGDHAKALENYEKAMAVWGENPADFAMIFNAGACAFKLQDFAKATTYFDKAVEGNYKVENAYQYKATILKAQKNADGYVAMIKEGLTKVPESALLKDMLAKNYVTMGTAKYNEAAGLLKVTVEKVTAGKLKTTDAAYKTEMGKAKSTFQEAVKIVNQALEVNPADETAKKVKAACEQSIKSITV